MATREQELRDKTFKDQGMSASERVLTMLLPDTRYTDARNSKLLALLITHLTKKGLISEEELDDILLDSTR